jgi:hypothetical protein
MKLYIGYSKLKIELRRRLRRRLKLSRRIRIVCRESRSVACETGGIGYHGYEKQPAEVTWWSNRVMDDPWIDIVRDYPHLNWTPNYEIDTGHIIENGSSILNLAWEASQLSGEASMMMEYMQDEPWAACSDDIKALNRLPSWLMVLRVIVVHSYIRSAAQTGRFGLLGDTRVQVIDASNREEVETFYALTEAYESGWPVTTKQNFVRPCLEALNAELKNWMDGWCGLEDQATTLRPAIMFRLCTQMCNSIGGKACSISDRKDVDNFITCIAKDDEPRPPPLQQGAPVGT